MKAILLAMTCCFLVVTQQEMCKSKNQDDMANQKCSQRGTVVDKTDLDGCGLLIQTSGGQLLLPAEYASGVDQSLLKAGAKIRFDYTEVGGMSICMAEDAIVRIDCLEAA